MYWDDSFHGKFKITVSTTGLNDIVLDQPNVCTIRAIIGFLKYFRYSHTKDGKGSTPTWHQVNLSVISKYLLHRICIGFSISVALYRPIQGRHTHQTQTPVSRENCNGGLVWYNSTFKQDRDHTSSGKFRGFYWP